MIRSFIKLLLWLVFTAALIALGSPVRGEVRLAWDSNPETNIFEYRVHRVEGTVRTLLASTPATLATVEALPGWVVGVTAVNTSGLESLLSATIVIPAPPIPPPTYPTLDRLLTTVSASSQELAGENGRTTNAIDGVTTTYWSSKWTNQPPHHITLNLGAERRAAGILYSPTQDGDPNGSITDYEISISQDAAAWAVKASGTWANDSTDKQVTWSPVPARHIRLTAKTSRYGGASELRALVADAPLPPPVTLTSGMESSLDLATWTRLYTTEGPATEKHFFRLFFHRSDGQRVNATYTIEPTP